MIKTLWDWLVKSSKDPNKISLTVKGAISTAVVVLGYFGITGVGIDTAGLGDNVAEIAVQVVAAITALATLYGAIRKLYLTIKGFFSG